MDFSFSQEQTMLADSVQRFIQDSYTFEQRQKLLQTEDGFSRDNWSQFAELGWLALPFPEGQGGFGGTSVETMILMEAFGKGLVVEPYLATITLAGAAISEALAIKGNDAQQAILAQIMEGKTLAALAFVEPQARFNLADIATTAKSAGGNWTLAGFKAVVLGGPSADYLVVPARTSGEQRDEQGISLFLVDASAKGVSRRDYPTIDGLRASEVQLEAVTVPSENLLGNEGEGFSLLSRVIDNAILSAGAQVVGAMEVLYKATVEYCNTREQFGQPIGKFQVLQHRMVDMFMEHEQAKSLLYMAALRMAGDDARAASKALSALKVQVGRGGRFVGQSAVQLHGGMGMTDELSVGHYFKRITAIETLFGDAGHHLGRYAAAE